MFQRKMIASIFVCQVSRRHNAEDLTIFTSVRALISNKYLIFSYLNIITAKGF